jgi:hypothetical protein
MYDPNRPLIFPLDQEVPMQEEQIVAPVEAPVKKVPNPEQYLYTGGNSDQAKDLLQQAVNLVNTPDQQKSVDPQLLKQQTDILQKYNSLSPDNEEVKSMRQFDSASRLLGSLADSSNQYLQAEMNKYSNTPREYTSTGLENKAISMAQAPQIQKQQEDQAKRLLESYKALVAKEKVSDSGASNVEKARILLGAGQGLAVEGRSLRGATRLDNKQVDSVYAVDDTIGKLRELEELKPAFDTGPIAGRVAAFRQTVGMDDASRTAFKNKTQRLLASYIKNISGTAASDNERNFLQSILPNANMNDETFLLAAQDFQKELEASKERLLNTYEKQGKVVEQFKTAPKESIMSPKDQQALDWAKSNPKDPRSAAILKKLGM